MLNLNGNNYNNINEPEEPNAKNKLDILKKSVIEFFEKNRSLVFLLPLLVIMLVVLIVLYSSGNKANKNNENYTVSGGKNQSGSISASTGNGIDLPSGNKIEVLPQTERETEKAAEDKGSENVANKGTSNPANPFDAPMKLSGIILNNKGSSVAIIETNNTSYVVKEGEFVNNIWKVEKIEEKGVLLVNGDKEAYLAFAK